MTLTQMIPSKLSVTRLLRTLVIGVLASTLVLNSGRSKN
jgi:hypothetical protein